MAKTFEEVDFLRNTRKVVFVLYFGFFKDFYCNGFIRWNVRSKFDFAEGAIANRSLYAVIANDEV